MDLRDKAIGALEACPIKDLIPPKRGWQDLQGRTCPALVIAKGLGMSDTSLVLRELMFRSDVGVPMGEIAVTYDRCTSRKQGKAAVLQLLRTNRFVA
jgi:hypothetical protein